MKVLLKQLAKAAGYRISRIPKYGSDSSEDLLRLTGTQSPLIFDVGANVGQSVERFRKLFSSPTIHSFEPSPKTFETLRRNVSGAAHVWNCGFGSSISQLALQENSYSDMSSFLSMGEMAWGKVVCETLVPVDTIDHFCDEHAIEHIDLLKSDTQGYECQVFQGAERMLSEGRIDLVYFEVIFSDQYRGRPFGDACNLLLRHGYRLVSFYEMFRQNGLLSWTDALFVHPNRLT